ncbi:putative photosystem I [Medicago truncatula]|uniref:Photosystem I P700 chlorophyll A apoprotein n=1 Tax=Medicago truncatula TaxID=3880 RepID=G7JXV8_MEDTR|nr:photosystem I P700 chlorophyll A apoprotein [Medicago truncatula]RHN55503.1 putative photosystem I [Medicago truncatula]
MRMQLSYLVYLFLNSKVFSAHLGQLSIIFLWLSGIYFYGACFSNYEAWLNDPTHIQLSVQMVWPIVGQEILNGDVGGNNMVPIP